jgi:electron transfer flavoprotein beta subunit
VRAIDDVDGSLGGLLAGYLDRPYAGLIRSVTLAAGRNGVLVQKEYPGGAAAELELHPPAVLGILSAEQPPRYVPVSRLRQVRKSSKLEDLTAVPPSSRPLQVESLFQPEEGHGATMLSGTPAELAQQLADIIVGAGLGR